MDSVVLGWNASYDTSCLTKGASEVTLRRREVVIGYMVEVAQLLSIHHEGIFIATNLFDRMLIIDRSKAEPLITTTQKMSIVAVECLRIASKQDDEPSLPHGTQLFIRMCK